MTNEQEKKLLEEFYSTFPKHAGIIEMHEAGAIGHLDAMTAIHQFNVWKSAKLSSQDIIDAKDKEIEELTAQVSELTKKLAEQQAKLDTVRSLFIGGENLSAREKLAFDSLRGDTYRELTKLLAESGNVPDSFQVLVNDAIEEAHKAMLSAAPKGE